MSRSKNRKIADLISGTTFDDGVVAASEVTGLATVATSGSFSDLSNQPTPFDPSTLGTASTQATGAFATAAQGTTADAALPKAGGAVTGNVTFGDNDRVVMGAGSDLQIWHDGPSGVSYINESGSGNFVIGGDNLFLNASNGHTYLSATQGGAVAVKHNNSTKLATFSGGVSVTGSVNADGLSLGDGDIANFGNSNDLQIYHDGSNSWIKDTGTGNLVLQSNHAGVHIQSTGNENIAQFNTDGAVKLYYDNAKKFETTTSGIDVTGTVNADALTGIGSIDATTAAAITAAGVGGAVDLSGGVGSSGINITNGTLPPIGAVLLVAFTEGRIGNEYFRKHLYGKQFTASNSSNRVVFYSGTGTGTSFTSIESGTWQVMTSSSSSGTMSDCLVMRLA